MEKENVGMKDVVEELRNIRIELAYGNDLRAVELQRPNIQKELEIEEQEYQEQKRKSQKERAKIAQSIASGAVPNTNTPKGAGTQSGRVNKLSKHTAKTKASNAKDNSTKAVYSEDNQKSIKEDLQNMLNGQVGVQRASSFNNMR